MINLLESGQILYISSVDISVGNGPGVNEIEFISGLHRTLGERAHFLIPRPKTSVSEVPEPVCTYCSAHHNHNLRYFPGHILSQWREADRLLNTGRFDLLVFRLDLLPFAPLHIIRKQRVPFAIKTLGKGLMNVISERIGWPLGSLLGKLNQRMIRDLVSNALVIDTVSELQKSYLDEIFNTPPGKIVYIDNAVNTHRFFPMPAEEARKKTGLEKYHPIVGFAGNHAAERGGTQLIKAAPELLSKHPDLGIVILGNMNGNGDLLALAQRLGVEDHVCFTGYVPFNLVPTYINAFDIGTSLLSLKHQGQSELKVRQYIACGKPVLATTPGSNDFIAGNDLGSLVQVGDLTKIVIEIDRWISLTEGEKHHFAGRAFQYAQDQLSVEQMLHKRLLLWSERLNQQGM